MIDILRKYNFWDKSSIPTGFVREHYLSNIHKYFGNDLIKVLIGQRRVGKSYLLRQIIKALIDSGVKPNNIFYLNKEIHDFDFVKNHHHLKKLIETYRKHLKPQGKIYIFLDEVQDIEGWEKIVNSFAQDYVEQYEVCITGSNAKMLSSELTTYISGRHITFDIYPFSFTEYCQHLKRQANKESFLTYLKAGGLPELFALTDEEVKSHYIQSLKDTILLKDIVARHNIKNATLLEQIFLFLADNVGNLFSFNSIVKSLKGQGVHLNVETLSNYVQYLQETYVIHSLDRYDVKGKRLLEGVKKYYLNDLAFKNYLFSGFDPGVGHYLENIIYLHYLRQGYNIYVGTLDKKEVDFVLEKSGQKKYVQVAYLLASEDVIAREFGNLEKISDNYEKIVVSLDDVVLGEKEGIKHVQAWDLLSN